MEKGITYWRILRAYHKDLYNSWLYWISGLLIFAGFILPLFVESLLSVGVLIAVVGIILLMVAKYTVLQQKIPSHLKG